MLIRVLTAVVGILAVIGIVSIGGAALALVVMAVALLAWLEYAKMLRPLVPVYTRPAAAALVVMIGAASFSSLPLFFASVLLSFILLFFLILVIQQKEINSLFYTVLGALYFGIGFGSLLFLRDGDQLLDAGAVSIHGGLFLIWFAFIGTWASDSFAYLVGKSMGRRKMAPHISPNKTVEGLLGGIAGCVVLCLAYAAVFDYSLLHALGLSLMIAIAAPMGDLFESYIKRVCDVKDSGHLLPGHGGMMDRFDSLLFVAPLMVAFLAGMRHL